MIRRVLVVLNDLNADHPALKTAWRSFPMAELHLLHVLDAPNPSLAAGPEAALANMHFALAEADDTPRRKREAEHALTRLGQGEVVPSPDPAGEILARAPHFDLILMGTRGRAGLERLLLGSVAERVIRESPVPVLTVRLGQEVTCGPFYRLLLVRDFSDTAEQTQTFVREHFPGADVDPLYTSPDLSTPLYTSHHPAALSLLHQHQEELTAQYRERVRSEDAQLMPGDPAQVALNKLATDQYDLLVIGTQGRSLLERFLHGSVVGQVIREARTPVLIARNIAAKVSADEGDSFDAFPAALQAGD